MTYVPDTVGSKSRMQKPAMMTPETMQSFSTSAKKNLNRERPRRKRKQNDSEFFLEDFSHGGSIHERKTLTRDSLDLIHNFIFD
jgi:hypothetical protein